MEGFGPQLQPTENLASSLTAVLAQIYASMALLAADRMVVLLPQPVDMDERALARAVLVMFERGQRKRPLGLHHRQRSELYARLTSPEAVAW